MCGGDRSIPDDAARPRAEAGRSNAGQLECRDVFREVERKGDSRADSSVRARLQNCRPADERESGETGEISRARGQFFELQLYDTARAELGRCGSGVRATRTQHFMRKRWNAPGELATAESGCGVFCQPVSNGIRNFGSHGFLNGAVESWGARLSFLEKMVYAFDFQDGEILVAAFFVGLAQQGDGVVGVDLEVAVAVDGENRALQLFEERLRFEI